MQQHVLISIVGVAFENAEMMLFKCCCWKLCLSVSIKLATVLALFIFGTVERARQYEKKTNLNMLFSYSNMGVFFGDHQIMIQIEAVQSRPAHYQSRNSRFSVELALDNMCAVPKYEV
uniref:(northern house mosquito) hypothetical protein n=1 Tax=Culex pipiens TaxID=7175 RepID=A0A8D8N2J0_CULPI